MAHQLEGVDSIYQNTINNLPVKERIVYCEQLIDKVQLSLIRNKRLLSKTTEDQLTIMKAAQEEVKNLRDKQK